MNEALQEKYDNDVAAWNNAVNKCIDIMNHSCSVEECNKINSNHCMDCNTCTKLRLRDVFNEELRKVGENK